MNEKEKERERERERESKRARERESKREIKRESCLPSIIPPIKFHPNRMKNRVFQIFEILDPQNFFESSAEAKLSKLEPFAWSHWIRNCLNYFQC